MRVHRRVERRGSNQINTGKKRKEGREGSVVAHTLILSTPSAWAYNPRLPGRI